MNFTPTTFRARCGGLGIATLSISQVRGQIPEAMIWVDLMDDDAPTIDLTDSTKIGQSDLQTFLSCLERIETLTESEATRLLRADLSGQSVETLRDTLELIGD